MDLSSFSLINFIISIVILNSTNKQVYCAYTFPSPAPRTNFHHLQIEGCRIYNDDASTNQQNLPSHQQQHHHQPMQQLQYQQHQLTQSMNGSSSSNSGFAGLPLQIGIECQNITGNQLYEQLSLVRFKGVKITSMIVRDSNLAGLGNMPESTHELRKLVFSNTSIDLEVLKEGSESLDQLSTLEIVNEKISNIPRNFFQEMQSLKELRLENDEIASLDADAFHNLDDSLEVLVLKNNRFNRFPMAVTNLTQLTVLDLLGNDVVIDPQDGELPDKLEALIQLRELKMIRFNCTCEFGSSPFFEWVAKTHISGVRCNAPEKFKSQEIIVLRRDELCEETNSFAESSQIQFNIDSIKIFVAMVSLLLSMHLFELETMRN